MLRIKRNWQIGILFATLIGLAYSCNQDYPNLIKNEKGNDISVAGRAPKVLYVMLTGAKGKAVKKAVDDDRLPHLKKMQKHSIYTYDGIADYKQPFDTLTRANGWMNMLTGVDQDKTKADTPYYADMKLNKYPSFITRIKQKMPELGTTVFTSADVLTDSVLMDADVARSFNGDDDATVAATTEALGQDDSTSVFLTQLEAVEKAGEADSFTVNSTSYMEAIVKAGKQIDKLMEAVENRENYEGENWLIIVASGKGGGPVQLKQVGDNTYDDALRNTFIMFYNKDFQQYFVPKPRNTSGAGYYEGKTTKLYGGSGGSNATVPSKSVYNPGSDSITIEAKFRFLPDNSATNAFIISKGRDYGAIAGWGVRDFGETLQAQVADGTNGTSISSNVKVQDGKWHTLALVIWNNLGVVRVKFFVDNVSAGTSQFNSSGINTNTDLHLGYGYYLWGDPPTMNIADVRIWDARIPDDVIKEYSCIPGTVPTTHPFYNDLVGLWPCIDGSGNKFKDVINGNDASIGPESAEWYSFQDVSPNVCPDPAPFYYEKVPNSVDIPFEIFNWLSINVSDNWNLDGKAWLTGYTDVTNPIN